MKPRVIIFFGNFFFSISTALSVYVLLPYLTEFMPKAFAGLVISGGGLLAIALFLLLPRWEARYGAQQLALFFATVEMLSFLALAVAPGAVSGTLFMIVALSLQPCIYYTLDLLLEALPTPPGEIGRVRTLFLTAWNVGALAAPLLLAAILMQTSEYGRVLVGASGMLLPLIVLFAARDLPKSRGPKFSHLQDTLHCIIKDRDLSAVTIAHFFLYLFYIWAPFYIPVYLHNELGIAWSALGWIFSLALVPYVLIEYPAGWIADRYLGDKELMLAGFLITGVALASLSTLSPASSLGLILMILLFSRSGAALIEAMTEGHFFRRVTEQDVNSISIFRGVWPLANIVGPVFASLILLFFNFQAFFLITGLLLAVLGVIVTLRIKDFR